MRNTFFNLGHASIIYYDHQLSTRMFKLETSSAKTRYCLQLINFYKVVHKNIDYGYFPLSYYF